MFRFCTALSKGVAILIRVWQLKRGSDSLCVHFATSERIACGSVGLVFAHARRNEAIVHEEYHRCNRNPKTPPRHVRGEPNFQDTSKTRSLKWSLSLIAAIEFPKHFQHNFAAEARSQKRSQHAWGTTTVQSATPRARTRKAHSCD